MLEIIQIIVHVLYVLTWIAAIGLLVVMAKNVDRLGPTLGGEPLSIMGDDEL